MFPNLVERRCSTPRLGLLITKLRGCQGSRIVNGCVAVTETLQVARPMLDIRLIRAEKETHRNSLTYSACSMVVELVFLMN